MAPSILACLLPSFSPTSSALPPISCHTLVLSGLHSVPQLCHGFLALSLGTFSLLSKTHAFLQSLCQANSYSYFKSQIAYFFPAAAFYEPLVCWTPLQRPYKLLYFPFNDVNSNNNGGYNHQHLLTKSLSVKLLTHLIITVHCEVGPWLSLIIPISQMRKSILKDIDYLDKVHNTI